MSPQPSEAGSGNRPPPAAEDELHSELEKYGIAPVATAGYHWGGFRYSNAGDAIAAAKRALG